MTEPLEYTSRVPTAPLLVRSDRAAFWFFIATVAVDWLMLAAGLGVAAGWREWALAEEFTRSHEAGFVATHFGQVLLYCCGSLYIAFKYVDVYRERRFLTGNREAGRISKAILAFVLVNIFVSAASETFYIPSRLTLGLSFFFCTGFVLAGRSAIALFRERLRARGGDIRVALIIGAGGVAEELAATLANTTRHGYRLVGCVADGQTKTKRSAGGLRIFGDMDRLERVVRRLRVSEVFICEPDWDAAQVLRVFTRLRAFPVKIRLASHLFDIVTERVKVPVDAVGDTPILDFGGAPGLTWRSGIKRIIDITFAFFLLIFFSWLWLILAAAVYLDSKGAIFFKQKRVGQGGRIFSFYKFRSMVADAEALREKLSGQDEIAGHMFKIKRDPRITRVGRFLRKYSLDETPQFFNVLRGDMTLIGPRPPLPSEVENYADWHLKRLTGPMGITGLWQISGRNQLSFDEMALLDIYYLRNHSLFLDYRIFIRTIFTVLLGQGL